MIPVPVSLDPSNAKATFVRSAHKDAKIVENHVKPCDVGIHWKAFAEYSQVSIHVPGFTSFFSGFGINLYGPN